MKSNDVRIMAIHLQVALRSDTSWDWAGWGLGLQSHVSDQLPVCKHKWFISNVARRVWSVDEHTLQDMNSEAANILPI